MTDSDIITIPGAGSCPLPTDLEGIIEALSHDVARMNETIRKAMAAGAIVEIKRTDRVHSGDGRWADQMSPVVNLDRAR